MEWTTVTVIIALTGLVVGIATPIVKLTSSITKFSTILENLIAQEKKAEDENRASHKEIWERNDEQDDLLNKHEQRIGILEHDHFRQFPACSDNVSCNSVHT